MKAVILAGGLGTRLSEETAVCPKPLVEIGGHPILWHIMKIYSAHGINDFVVCLGYRGQMIKEYFANYLLSTSDVIIDVVKQQVEYVKSTAEPWRVALVDTGADSGTGGRLKRITPYLDGEDLFCLTYGDGVADIDISRLLAFHRCHGRLATVTVTRPPQNFGVTNLDGDRVRGFEEKPEGGDIWINGGFFVLSPKVAELIDADETYWEREPMRRLVELDELRAFHHEGFWHTMDTLRDKQTLEDMWRGGNAPWMIW